MKVNFDTVAMSVATICLLVAIGAEISSKGSLTTKAAVISTLLSFGTTAWLVVLKKK